MRDKESKGTKRLATTLLTALLAALLAALLLAPVASAQTAGTTSFPGTGGAIAFSSERDGFATFNVYRMNADGFGQTRLTDLPGRNLQPAWSSDGDEILPQRGGAAPRSSSAAPGPTPAGTSSS